MKRDKVLNEAMACICGGRETDYGTPEQSFGKISALWSAFLDVDISPSKAAVMMALFKIGRIASGQTKEDNYVDGCGYLGVAAELAETEEDKRIVKCAADMFPAARPKVNDLDDAARERNEKIALELARNMCSAFDNRCATCPVGKKQNGTGLDCTQFRLQHPEKAYKLMQAALETKRIPAPKDMGDDPNAIKYDAFNLYADLKSRIGCNENGHKKIGCSECPVSSYNNGTKEGCRKYIASHPEEAIEAVNKFLKEHLVKAVNFVASELYEEVKVKMGCNEVGCPVYRCKSCPIGSVNNGNEVSCKEFVEKSPGEATKIMEGFLK